MYMHSIKIYLYLMIFNFHPVIFLIQNIYAFNETFYSTIFGSEKKKAVLKLFEEAIIDFGAPSRIRTDKGGENTHIWELKTEIRGNARGSFLASSSVYH